MSSMKRTIRRGILRSLGRLKRSDGTYVSVPFPVPTGRYKK